MANGAKINDTTKQVLGKYGVSNPQAATQAPGTTIINNNTTVNNYGGYGGPVQGRALQFAQKTDRFSKIKAWIESIFNRQNAAAKERYRAVMKNERDYSKTTNGILRKLEELSSKLKNAFGGGRNRRGGSDISSQVKKLLFLFGLGTLAKNWGTITDITKKIRTKLDSIFGENGKGSQIEATIISFFGGKPGETAPKAFVEFFTGEDGILGIIKHYLNNLFEDRAEAIRGLKKPPGNVSKMRILDGSAIMMYGRYISNVIACLFGGTKVAAQLNYDDLLKDPNINKTRKSFGGKRDTDNDRFYIKGPDNKLQKLYKTGYCWIGDGAIVGSNVISNSDLKSETRLANNRASSILQGKELLTMIKETETSTVHTIDVMKGLQRLKTASSEYGYTLVGEDFFSALSRLGYGTPDEIKAKLGVGEPENYRFVLMGIGSPREADALGIRWESGIGATPEKHLNKVVRMVPSNYELLPGEEFLLNSAGKPLEYSCYRIFPEMFQLIESGLGMNMNVTDKESIEKLEGVLTTNKKLILSVEKSLARKPKDVEKIQAKLDDVHSDTKDYGYGTTAFEDVDAMLQHAAQRDAEFKAHLESSRAATAASSVRSAAVSIRDGIKTGISNITRSIKFKDNEDFIQQLYNIIGNALKKKGIDDSRFIPWIVGQVSIESGWGKSSLATKYNNFSGITTPNKLPDAESYEPGTVLESGGRGGRQAVTLSNSNGQKRPWYTVYKSPEDWASDYIDLLSGNTYNAFGGDPSEFAERVKNYAGKNNAETYKDSIIQQHASIEKRYNNISKEDRESSWDKYVSDMESLETTSTQTPSKKEGSPAPMTNVQDTEPQKDMGPFETTPAASSKTQDGETISKTTGTVSKISLPPPPVVATVNPNATAYVAASVTPKTTDKKINVTEKLDFNAMLKMKTAEQGYLKYLASEEGNMSHYIGTSLDIITNYIQNK